MIHDSLKNFPRYEHIHPAFGIVSRFIDKPDFAGITGSDFSADSGIKAIISDYETKEASAGLIECHRKFIDIQILIAGEEYIGVCRKEKCSVKQPYDPEKDFEELAGECDLAKLSPGYFMIFYPDDGHMPGIMAEKKCCVKKMVLKVPFCD